MIKYILECKNKHKFESWFSTSKEFEKLQKNNLLECIHCESKAISKSIMSPNILNKKEKKIKNENDNLKKIKKDLKNLRKFVENNFEFVGNKFANKAREAYYDKKNNKNIYGITSDKEKTELQDEGIDVVSIPWIDKDN
tara:strand:- start:1058 stop:1474 length:417 start_codon:yes stop_codon:yes gene_type:complete